MLQRVTYIVGHLRPLSQFAVNQGPHVVVKYIVFDITLSVAFCFKVWHPRCVLIQCIKSFLFLKSFWVIFCDFFVFFCDFLVIFLFWLLLHIVLNFSLSSYVQPDDGRYGRNM